MSVITDTQIGIPSILKVEPGASNHLGNYLKSAGFTKVVMYFGNDLIDMFGIRIMKSLSEAGIEVLSYQELDDVNIEDLVQLAFEIPNSAQAIIGMGGGKVIDGAKYMAFLRGIPFISFPTSSSSDGFASASASLLVNGKRKSVPAKLAYGVIVDTNIIRTAPARFIFSGIGDMVAKITAIYDWQFEAAYGVSELNDFAVMIAKKAVNSFVRTPFEAVNDPVYLRELMDSLAMSGVANVVAGNSSPTSGSEHLISHALDSFSEHPQLHGIQVGIATYLMARVQNHRYERIDKVFTDTGFWDYVETLNLDVKDYLKAIDLAPSMKPFRKTYLHQERYRRLAKQILLRDERLTKVFHLDPADAFSNVDGILFDIDGTLWDSTGVVADSYNQYFEQKGLSKRVTADDLKPLFGKPMDVIFKALLPDLPEDRITVLSEECMALENENLAKTYAPYYPKIHETFEALSKKLPLFIVSNCQKGYIEIVMKGAGLEPFIKDYLCFGDTGTDKGHTILTLMEKNGLKNPVYVGDIQSDADACQAAGISIIHASYGFGTIKKPYAVIKKPEDLLTLFDC